VHGGEHATFHVRPLARSSFPNHVCRALVIAHPDKRAMPEMPRIGPFEERDQADHLRLDPPAFRHFFRG
jgi:hypothetical protein